MKNNYITWVKLTNHRYFTRIAIMRDDDIIRNYKQVSKKRIKQFEKALKQCSYLRIKCEEFEYEE